MDRRVEPQDRPPEGRARWGLGDAAAGFLVGLLATTTTAALWLSVTGDDRLSLAGRAVAQMAFWTGLVGAAVLASRRKGAGDLGSDFGFAFRRPDAGWGVLAGVGAQVILLPLVALLLQPLLGNPDVDRPVQQLVDDTKGVAVIGLFAFVVLGAAVVEELFFRGLLLRALQKRAGTGVAVAVSSLAFGLSHAQDGLSTEGLVLVLTSLTLLGGLFALLAVRAGRLGPAIVAHATFNAFTLIVVLSR